MGRKKDKLPPLHVFDKAQADVLLSILTRAEYDLGGFWRLYAEQAPNEAIMAHLAGMLPGERRAIRDALDQLQNAVYLLQALAPDVGEQRGRGGVLAVELNEFCQALRFPLAFIELQEEFPVLGELDAAMRRHRQEEDPHEVGRRPSER